MLIRVIRRSDFPTLINIYRQCFREPPWFEEFEENEVLADFRQACQWPETIFLVAEISKRVAGAAIAYDLCRKPEVNDLVLPDGRVIYTAEVFVDRRYRGNGLAKILIFSHLALAKIRGFTHLAVRTSVDQPVIQHIFCDLLGAQIVTEQNVVSTKVIDGVARQLPDRRIIMIGKVPELALSQTLRAVWPAAQATISL